MSAAGAAKDQAARRDVPERAIHAFRNQLAALVRLRAGVAAAVVGALRRN